MPSVLRFLVVALVAAPVVAQPSGIYLTGGLVRSDFDADRLSLLNETYSDFYASRLDGPVDLVPTRSEGFVVGATGRINPGGFTGAFGYQYGQATSDVTSVFENGTGDRVTTRTADHAAWTEVTISFGPVVVGGHAGGLFRGTRIASATVYPDGTESLGSEYRLNGVYTASTTFIEAGPVVGLHLGRVLIPARVLFPYELGGTTRIPITDYDTRQGNDTFPRDFDRFADDPNGLDDGAAISDRDFVGMRVQVGVEVRLF